MQLQLWWAGRTEDRCLRELSSLGGQSSLLSPEPAPCHRSPEPGAGPLAWTAAAALNPDGLPKVVTLLGPPGPQVRARTGLGEPAGWHLCNPPAALRMKPPAWDSLSLNPRDDGAEGCLHVSRGACAHHRQRVPLQDVREELGGKGTRWTSGPHPARPAPAERTPVPTCPCQSAVLTSMTFSGS